MTFRIGQNEPKPPIHLIFSLSRHQGRRDARLPGARPQLDDLALPVGHQRHPGGRDGPRQDPADHLPARLHEALPSDHAAPPGHRAQVDAT